ncbi:MAG: bifunctional folylpolyglutamate synthase/dihydrofolate synthase, partial [Candidatus Omnitrophica bacterium]|nr:bifunctional folylpolyglutamate synthase/dihydrofolate synthase [Candidatus Omnitrophota bacterium]
MTYPQAIQYLESFVDYERLTEYPYKQSFRLERIRGLLNSIDNPQNSLRCIHIAGTKGKGSTSAFVTYILREAGYRVGLYTSPHLSGFRERIRIIQPRTQNLEPKTCFEGMILEEELADLVERFKPAIDKYSDITKYGPLSFFEVYTVLAFVYFKEQNVDFAVLETGLGGRLDATNTVNPYICAITPISLEHRQLLGDSLGEIAGEKAGIIKPNAIVVSAPQETEVLEVIRDRCKEMKAKLFEVGKDIFYEKQTDGFSVLGAFGEYPGLAITLLGKHQIVNATLAVGIIEALRFYGIILDAYSIRQGLYHTLWPGRCEVISREPFVVLDGAQNLASAKALKEAIRENFSAEGGSASGGRYKKLILVLGISKDK